MSEAVDTSHGDGFKSDYDASKSSPQALAALKEEKQWILALQSRDCKRLMDLLHQNRHLWLKTGPDDRTVLHVAVIQGCVDLIKQVLGLGIHVDHSNRPEFNKSLRRLLNAKDGKLRTDVFRLAPIVGNEEVIHLLNSTRKSRTMIAQDSSLSTPSYPSSSTASSYHGIDSTSIASHEIDIKSPYFSSLLPEDEDEIRKLFEEMPRSASLEELRKQMKGDVDYNFDTQRKGLIFNFACERAHANIEFIRSVVEKARSKPGLVQKLFNQMDAQGRTPLHVATQFCSGKDLAGIQELLKLIPNECVNGRDGAGRTALMRATANGMSLEASKVVKVLACDERTDLNAEWPGFSRATALHVAVLHGHGASAKFLLEAYRKHPAERADVEKQMKRLVKVFRLQWYSMWTPLELAAVMGRYTVLAMILQASGKSRKSICDQRCLHLAAAAGDPRSIQALLLNRNDDLQNFETNEYFGGYSCLHFAVNATLPNLPSYDSKPPNLKPIDESFDRFLIYSDFASIYWLQQELTLASLKGPRKLGLSVIGYGHKKTCTTLLLQAGVDIWPSRSLSNRTSSTKDFFEYAEEDDAESSSHNRGQDFHIITDIMHHPNMPDPGNDASEEAQLWWYQVVAKETLEAKNNFNAAGNATAVVATLVATASVVGPLSPPLGYGSGSEGSQGPNNGVQMNVVSIRIFMASNSLSFYLAIASIMLAIMPSLPMPQEGLREELRRSQRTVALAISMLLLAILGLLVSFTSSIVAVTPANEYWGFKFYPAFVGGVVCVVVNFLFFLRLLRLVFNRNAKIKSFYYLFGKL